MNDDCTRTARRQRSRMACEPCRDRKRKCGGGQPCDLCIGFGYECHYRPRARKRRTAAINKATTSENGPQSASPLQQRADNVQASISLAGSPEEQPHPHEAPRDAGVFARSLESNSGSAFVRTFAMAVDPNNAPPFQFLAWNAFLGERQLIVANPLPRSITSILSARDLQGLARIYFEKVDPCYGFLDAKVIEDAARSRWQSTQEYTLYDAVLCGVAAIGCLFSSLQDLNTEASLCGLAKSLLDLSVAEEASVETATAWLLRTIYLRLTARPDEAWIASCMTLHAIDAVGLHREPDASTVFRRAAPDITPDNRRRMFGVARHINIWLSFDLARSRVILQNVSSVSPSPRPNDYTTELLGLLPYTESLDPGKTLSGDEIVTAFSEVLDRTHTQPPSILAQCNLMLCLYRRLYTMKWNVPSETLTKAVSLIQRGIRAVRMAVEAGSPWHHVANVPFQSICTLLAIDQPYSFTELDSALKCLEFVSQTYGTKATNDAAGAARTLIYMHQKRREADVRRQEEMLKFYPAPQTMQEETLGEFPISLAFTELPWFNDLLPDFDIGNLGNGELFGNI